MSTEIERKYLIRNDSWRAHAGKGQVLRQAYLASGPPSTVRVRLANDRAWLTIKGPVTGISRAEYEYPIPLSDAVELLAFRSLDSIIEKTRYRIPHDGLIIEVDEFSGANTGLLLAEVELPSEKTIFSTPEWFGEDVTDDTCYHNSQLSRHPYISWN